MDTMISRRLIGHGLAALLTAFVAVGCANHAKTNSIETKSGQVADARGQDVMSAPAPNGAQSADPPFSAAEALKRKTAAYSQQVESMIDHGDKAPAGSTTAPSVAMQQQQQQQQQQQHSPPQQPQHGPKPQASSVDWRDPRDPKVAATAGAPDNAQAKQLVSSNTPAVIDAPRSEWNGPLNVPAGPSDALAQKIAKRVREYPRDVSGHLDYQLLRFLQDERVPDLNTISTLPSEDRELIAAVIDGLSNFRSGLRQDNNMLASRKIRPLLEMTDRLRSEADLTIPTIALCTTVRTFGEYDPINPLRFAAHKEHDVILYCEIENFSSQIDEKQMWVTKLSKDAVLYTESGTPVWSDKSETITDTARRRRHDFFIVKKLRLPALTVGRYLMKVTIQDTQVNRVVEATLPIVIAVPSAP
jgi:hypothetical protein